MLTLSSSYNVGGFTVAWRRFTESTVSDQRISYKLGCERTRRSIGTCKMPLMYQLGQDPVILRRVHANIHR